MEHDKAPWKQHKETSDPEITGGVENTHIISPQSILARVYDTDTKRGQANANLIAAAPYLLRTCEELAAWILIDPNFQDWPAAQSYLKDLQGVIARAKGEQAPGGGIGEGE